jgi:hypothetical protein
LPPGRASPLSSQFGPLILSQDIAEAEQHARIGLFEFSARLRDTIDLHQDLRFVRTIGGDQRLHRHLLFLDRGRQVDEMKTALLKGVFDPLLLIRGEADTLYESGVPPPRTSRTDQGSSGPALAWTRAATATATRPSRSGTWGAW